MNLGLLQHGPQIFGNRAALQRTRRLSAKVKLVAPREIVHERRAGQSRDAGRFVARPSGQRRRTEIMSKHRNAWAVGNRPDVRARRLGAARVIEGDEFDGPAPDTALGVQFVDHKPRRDQAFLARQARRSGQGVGESNADRRRTAPDNEGPDDGNEQDGAHDAGRNDSSA
jgi:hypothetical protein